jgi:hypothetical protein
MKDFFKSREKKLEEARLKLDQTLESNGMEFLIKAMASEEIYSPLLEKQRREVISGTDDVSWYAYRKAEKLESDADKAELLALIEKYATSPIRSHIYFALAHLAKNRKDNELFNFLMKKLQSEKDNESKLLILMGVKEMKKDAVLNIKPIEQLTKSRNYKLRSQAILALQKTQSPEVEPLLLELFRTSKDSHTKSMICTPLESVGTYESAPILEREYKITRDHGLRSSIEFTLNKIKERKSAANQS